MSTSTSRSAEEQKAWTEGFNTGLALAAKRLQQMMLEDGPTMGDIDAALGPQLSSHTQEDQRKLKC